MSATVTGAKGLSAASSRVVVNQDGEALATVFLMLGKKSFLEG
jgi:hypothetical protein